MFLFRWGQTPRFAMLGLVCALLAGVGANQVEPTDPGPQPVADALDGDNDSNVEPRPVPGRSPRKDLVSVGLLVVAGIASMGLVLIGLTIFWGGRLRRLARKPLPEQSPVDELWYLKPSKQRPEVEEQRQEPGTPPAAPPHSPDQSGSP